MPLYSKELGDLAARVEIADFKLEQVRQHFNGFGAHILDLAKHTTFEKSGWGLGPSPVNSSMLSGYLYVHPEEYEATDISYYLDQNLGHQPWWHTEDYYDQQEIESPETQSSISLDGVKQQFAFNDFKVLGNRGANKAVDMVMFLHDETDNISIVVIRRPDHTWATPGGMSEGVANKKTFAEFLEERYSDNMFCKDSETLKSAMEIAKDIDEHVKEILKDKAFNALDKDALCQLIIADLSNIKTHFLSLEESGVNQEDLQDLAMMFKCKLYEKCFPDTYMTFYSAVMSPAKQMEDFIVLGDPRNTGGDKGAYIVTTPYTLVLDSTKLKALEEQALLQPKGGNDTTATSIFSLDELLKKDVYATQRALILKALKYLVDKQELEISESQMQAITETVTIRESQAKHVNDIHTQLIGAKNTLNQMPNEKGNPIRLEQIYTVTRLENELKKALEETAVPSQQAQEALEEPNDSNINQGAESTEPPAKTCWESFFLWTCGPRAESEEPHESRPRCSPRW